jgi:peptidoglycan/LPS O-acetylase OafA/YrhL
MNLYISYNAATPGFALDALWTIRFFAFFFYAIVLSLLSYRFIERPALALRARLYSEGPISPLPFDWYKWVAINLVIAMALTVASRSFS